MRVLHIGTERLWRGGENQVRLLVEGLQTAAPDIDSFLAYPKKSHAADRLRNAPGVRKLLELPSSSGYDPRSIWKLARFCRVESIDLIDAHSSAAMSLGLALKKIYPKMKLVVHRRVDIAVRNNIVSRRKYLSPSVDRFIAISNAIGRVLLNAGVPIEKLTVVKSAVDETQYLGDFERRLDFKKKFASEKIRPESVWFGHAAALTWQKGFREMIMACSDLQQQNLSFQCLIAGDGPFREEMKAMIETERLGGSVHLIGPVKNVSDFLRSLDFLVVPSHFEGLGTILLEGAFAGCALIGSNVGGIPEIIQHRETGLLVEKGNAKVLAVAMKELILNEKLRLQLANHARHFVRAHFSVTKMVAENMKIYRQLVGS